MIETSKGILRDGRSQSSSFGVFFVPIQGLLDQDVACKLSPLLFLTARGFCTSKLAVSIDKKL